MGSVDPDPVGGERGSSPLGVDVPMRAVSLPLSADEFSPRWATEVVAARHPGAVVSAVEITDISAGTTTRLRLSLRYASGHGPASVFIKMQGTLDHRLLLSAIGGVWQEAMIARVGLPIERPLAYATAASRWRLQSMVVFEDLGLRGGNANDATRPLQAAQVAAGLQQLARLHARFWNLRPRAHPELRWLRVWRFNAGWRLMGTIGAAAALRADPQTTALLPPNRRSTRALGDLWRRWAIAARQGPLTLTHGDAHVGNTYQLADGELGFLDWQMPRLGSWAHDVGYFLISALSVDDRRTHERALIDTYLAALTGFGAAAPERDVAWRQYRRSPAYGLTTWVVTAGLARLPGSRDWQHAEITRQTCRRFAAAFTDLNTEEALTQPN